jgi:hypothetical protein
MKILQGKILKKDQVVLDNLKCKIQFHTSIGGIKAASIYPPGNP